MKVVYAVASANISRGDGTSVYIREGTHWPADDPLVLHNPGMFTDDPTPGLHSSAPIASVRPSNVEAATKEPGERRNVRRPIETTQP